MVLPQVFKKANFHGWDFELPCLTNNTQNDDTWSADYDVVVDQQLKDDFHYTSAREGAGRWMVSAPFKMQQAVCKLNVS